MNLEPTIAELMAATIPFTEAAERVPMTERTLRTYVATGKLPAYKVGNKLRVYPADLDRLWERVKPTREAV
jgi:excisionase family DNA binding protein